MEHRTRDRWVETFKYPEVVSLLAECGDVAIYYTGVTPHLLSPEELPGIDQEWVRRHPDHVAQYKQPHYQIWDGDRRVFVGPVSQAQEAWNVYEDVCRCRQMYVGRS